MQEQAPREYEIKKFELPDMSHSEMDDLIKSQLICRVTFNHDPYPYTLPMDTIILGTRCTSISRRPVKRWSYSEKTPM